MTTPYPCYLWLSCYRPHLQPGKGYSCNLRLRLNWVFKWNNQLLSYLTSPQTPPLVWMGCNKQTMMHCKHFFLHKLLLLFMSYRFFYRLCTNGIRIIPPYKSSVIVSVSRLTNDLVKYPLRLQIYDEFIYLKTEVVSFILVS